MEIPGKKLLESFDMPSKLVFPSRNFSEFFMGWKAPEVFKVHLFMVILEDCFRLGKVHLI